MAQSTVRVCPMEWSTGQPFTVADTSTTVDVACQWSNPRAGAALGGVMTVGLVGPVSRVALWEQPTSGRAITARARIFRIVTPPSPSK